jgi:hypothetical protein
MQRRGLEVGKSLIDLKPIRVQQQNDNFGMAILRGAVEWRLATRVRAIDVDGAGNFE